MKDIVEQLQSDPYNEGHQSDREARIILGALLNNAAKEIERLRDKCTVQAEWLRRLAPEKYPDTLFIHALVGNKDSNGMPEKLLIVPAYGCDFSYVYIRSSKTTGPEW